jgi:tRNA(Arg) A34 adenosine deaminase TadA
VHKIDKKILHYFEIAARIASKKKDKRTYLLGAVGIRSDGAIVTAKNGPTESPNPLAHAEARISRKLDWGAQVYVVRIRICDAKFAMAKPCPHCRRVLRSRGVSEVVYSIGPEEYGVLDLNNPDEYKSEYMGGKTQAQWSV